MTNTPQTIATGLLELAALCEKATGPDRELDFEIAEATGRPGMEGWEEITRDYTASLDAAVMLVPAGMTFYVDSGLLADGGCHACTWSPADKRICGGCKDAPTPALALCAAALRARASMGDGNV